MRLTKSQYKSLFNIYLKEEERSMVDFPKKSTISHSNSPVFNVKYKYKEQEGSFYVYTTNGTINESVACMCTSVSGDIFMTIELDFVIRVINEEKNYINRLLATTAHELGHLVSGHLNPDSEKYSLSWIDINKEDQIKYYNIANENKDDSSYLQYHNAVYKSLLQGGVLEKEYEADLVALHFVNIEHIIYIHTHDLICKKSNIVTKLEKINRINKLNEYYDNNILNNDDCYLTIEFYDKEKK